MPRKSPPRPPEDEFGRTRDQELVRLIEEFHVAEAEAGRAETAAHEADKRYQEAARRLAARMATHEIRDAFNGLVDHRSFLFGGRLYELHAQSDTLRPGEMRKYSARYYEPHILTR
jgi:hypothetical protein